MTDIFTLFPGQGSQKVGMGRELFDRQPLAKELFDRADKALGFSLSQICFEGPVDKLTMMYRNIESPRDFPQIILDQISHFFEHYKDLEPGKFVKVSGWVGIEEAKQEILTGIKAFKDAKDKPAF